MSTYTTPTDRALRALSKFVTEWIAPAAIPYVCGHHNRGTEPLRQAIIAIGKTVQAQPAGYLVCRREVLTQFDRDHRNGLIYQPISAIFDGLDLAQNAHEYATGKQPGHHVICELNEWGPR